MINQQYVNYAGKLLLL